MSAGPLEGELVGGAYRVLSTIGRGGMGTVYRAVDVASGRHVALKVLLPHLATPVRMARFAREAEVTARLDRLGGVVRVFASGVHRGAPYFAMELVEGEDLERLLERGALPVEQAVELLERIARTVGACHAAGVVHRDLKPANVLLDATGPKIVDFGLARDESSERLTRTGELVGTPFYMAPEQLAGEEADARADVYSLGAILYHALAGRPPFTASSLVELAARVNTADPEAPSRLRRDVSRDLEAVCLRALARVPGDRYPDATALADDLARVRRAERPTASTATGRWVGLSGILARARRGDRRAQLVVAGGGLAVVLAVMAGALAVGVIAPRRAARRALEEAQEWDGDRCERTPAACQGGPHHLARWDLGAGDGPAPMLADLEERAAAVERAASRLDGADALAARDLIVRLAALRALVGGSAEGPGAGPTGLLVQAVEARRRGDVVLALDHVARAREQVPGWPAARRLEARLWEDRLAHERRAAAVRELVRWLGARGRAEDERAIALGGARRGLGRWYLQVVSGAPTEGDPVTLGRDLAAPLACARELGLEESVAADLRREKVAALDADAERWEQALMASAPHERVAVARLGAVLVAEPAVEAGPRLVAALRRVLDALIAQAAREPTDASVVRAAALDDAIALHVDPAWSTPEALRRLVMMQTEAGHRVDLESVDLALVLTFLRTATSRGQGMDTVVRRAGASRFRALVEQRPRSLAARAARFLLSFAGRAELRDADDDARLREVARLADAVVAPDVVVDLAPVYAGEVEFELAFVRRCQMDRAARDGDHAGAERFGEQVLAHLRRCRAMLGPERVDMIRDAWTIEAEMVGAASAERGLATWEAGIADLRGRVERTDRGEGPSIAVLDPFEERHALVKLLVSAAAWVDRVAGPGREDWRARSLAWGREAEAVSRRFDGRAPHTAGMALAYVVRRARLDGRLDEAEAMVAAASPLYFENAELTREWCELARDRGDGAEFERRVREALGRHPDHRHLRQMLRSRGRER